MLCSTPGVNFPHDPHSREWEEITPHIVEKRAHAADVSVQHSDGHAGADWQQMLDVQAGSTNLSNDPLLLRPAFPWLVGRAIPVRELQAHNLALPRLENSRPVEAAQCLQRTVEIGIEDEVHLQDLTARADALVHHYGLDARSLLAVLHLDRRGNGEARVSKPKTEWEGCPQLGRPVRRQQPLLVHHLPIPWFDGVVLTQRHHDGKLARRLGVPKDH
mmetsp:Transcript_98974/g.229302  ORF Transcript_98974/g.229302 Transcript_98974/m.229302 type:complete len:217 (-) Transcript_98974:1323-1973(-)